MIVTSLYHGIKMLNYPDGNEQVNESVVRRETVWPEELSRRGLYLQPTDQPLRWLVRVRTGLVMLADGLAGPGAGIAVLSAFFPDGPRGASLTEQDTWARLTLNQGEPPGRWPSRGSARPPRIRPRHVWRRWMPCSR